MTSVKVVTRTAGCPAARTYARGVSDAEHELLLDNTAQTEEIARLRVLAARAAKSAIEAQDRADGHHDAWLDDMLLDVATD